MPPAIPDRWIAYKACGKVIDGTRIICFKVPLSRHVQKKVSGVKEIWDIKTLFKTIPKLAGVIDLTNTTRYYSPNVQKKFDIMDKGVSHKKIFMPGRMIPPQDKVIEFMDTVDEFLKKDDESLVGVHCTHGLNRTGYMVCRYLRDRLGLSAKDAIKGEHLHHTAGMTASELNLTYISDFQKARGYIMEREVYITDLLGTMSPHLPKSPTVYKSITEDDVNDKSIDFNDDDSNYSGDKRLHNRHSSDEGDEKKSKRKRNDSTRSTQDYDYKYDY